MKKIFIPITLIAFTQFLFTSCSNTTKKIPKAKIIVHEPQLIIGDPVSYSSDSITLFPVGLSSYVPNETTKPEASNSNGFITVTSAGACVNLSSTITTNAYNSSISTYSNTNTDQVDIRNLIFYNRYTGKNYKLTDKKLHVIAFSIHNEFKKPIMMFHVVKNDLNKDKKFDYKDPAMLYISDLDGKNFAQLSPEDEQFIDYYFYAETNKILLKVKTDTDSNKVFDAYDQSIYREVSLEKPALGSILFGEKMIDDLKKLL